MESEPTILLTGANGQLGLTLQKLWPQAGPHRRFQLLPTDVDSLDITDPDAITELMGSRAIAAIVNCAAYTAVDKAEEEVELAFAINADAAGNLAQAARDQNCSLIHISTDYVFAGTATSPYKPEDETGPLGVYGRSKLAGEQAIKQIWPGRSIVLRASWLYSPYGSNFLLTMLRLMRERESLSVVDDQLGAPTSTHGLVGVIFAALASPAVHGTYHWCDGAAMSWFEFAGAIQEEALRVGLLERAIPLHPIASSQYPTPAKRPGYSVLDATATTAALACPQQDWRDELALVLKQLAEQRPAEAGPQGKMSP